MLHELSQSSEFMKSKCFNRKNLFGNQIFFGLVLFVVKKTLSEKSHSARHQALGVKNEAVIKQIISAQQTDDGVVRWTRSSSRWISRVFPSRLKEVSHRSGVDDRPSQSARHMRSFHGVPAAVE